MSPSKPESSQPQPAGNTQPPGLTRRGFLHKGLAAAAGVSAVAAALSPLKDLAPGDVPSLEEFLQKHYKEMTAEEKQQALDRIAQEVEKSRARSARGAMERAYAAGPAVGPPEPIRTDWLPC